VTNLFRKNNALGIAHARRRRQATKNGRRFRNKIRMAPGATDIQLILLPK
jgi:hypothetical protein